MKKLFTTVLPFFLWITILAYFSNQPFQKQDISPLLQRVVSEDTLAKVLPPVEFYYGTSKVTYKKPYVFVQFFFRKAVHLISYGLLALLTLRVIRLKIKSWKAPMTTLCLVFLVAGFDEYNQGLSSFRTGSVYDVILDLVGGLIAVTLYLILKRR